MTVPYDVDDVVAQVAPVISGPIKDVEYDKTAKQFRYLVGFEMGGEHHQRWFLHDELTKVEKTEEAAPATAKKGAKA